MLSIPIWSRNQTFILYPWINFSNRRKITIFFQKVAHPKEIVSDCYKVLIHEIHKHYFSKKKSPCSWFSEPWGISRGLIVWDHWIYWLISGQSITYSKSLSSILNSFVVSDKTEKRSCLSRNFAFDTVRKWPEVESWRKITVHL